MLTRALSWSAAGAVTGMLVQLLLMAVLSRLLGALEFGLMASAGLALLTGLARSVWGVHGAAWTWAQPLFHLKVTLFVLMLGLSLPPTRQLGRGRTAGVASGALPPAAVVLHTRRAFMRASHLMLVLPLLAALVARGIGAR